MRSTRFPAALAVAALLVPGCGEKKDRPPAELAPEPAPAAAEAPPAPLAFGTVEGQVKLVGDAPEMQPLVRKSDPVCAATEAREPFVRVGDGGGLADVLVRLPAGAAPASEPPTAALVIDQKDCAYTPYVSGVIAGQTLTIRNSDATAHNVHAKAGSDSLLNRAQPQGQPPIQRTVSEPPGTVLTLTCDIHNWMRAYAVVSDHAVFATTAADGSFVLRNVPAGEHELEAWHPHLGPQKARVTVPPNGVARAVFELGADSFQRP